MNWIRIQEPNGEKFLNSSQLYDVTFNDDRKCVTFSYRGQDSIYTRTVQFSRYDDAKKDLKEQLMMHHRDFVLDTAKYL